MPEADKIPGAEEPAMIPYRDYGKARPYLVGLGAAAGFLFTLVLSNDYCCSALGAAIVAAASVYIVDKVGCVTPLARRTRGIWPRVAVALIIPLVLALSPLFRLGKDESFELAFGMKPPPGVSNLVVERHYEGGSGDYTLLLQFTADHATMQQITSWREFAPDDEFVLLWRESNGDWAMFVEGLLRRLYLHPQWWRERTPMRDPEILLWWPEREVKGTLLLWDRETGVAYAAHWLG